MSSRECRTSDAGADQRIATPTVVREPLCDGPLPAAVATRRISSRDLLCGERELVIEHAGREYRLRVTHRGKLILTA